jgi:polysaccharide biosynthesis transport protein
MNPSLYPSPARLANRRKLLVFSASFLLLAVAGLLYSYSRPAIYLASARVQINPGAVQVEAAVASGGTQGANTLRPLPNELQVLTSRPLVKEALEKIAPGQAAVLAQFGADPASTLQAGLDAVVAEGTDIVELSSRGPDAQWAARLVNALVVAYTRQLGEAYAQTASTSLAQTRDEVARLTQKVQAQRRQVEDFRLRHSIVSFEREENDILGRVKGQTEAQNKANEKLAMAEGRLRAMTESASTGRPIAAPTRPNATLENMEQRASEAREELSELNRGFTPEYLAMDPRARALRTRLAELERQIAGQRQSSSQSAQTDQSAGLADAREEASAARATVARIAQQSAGDRSALQKFASRFDEFRTLRDALAPLESLLRDASQRLVRQEAGEASRRPSVRVLEPAVTPREPWQPQYTRDAAIVLGSAFLLALLAVWVVELFNRVDAPPPVVLTQGAPYPSPYSSQYPPNYPSPYGTYPALPPYDTHPDGALAYDARSDAGLTRPSQLAMGHTMGHGPDHGASNGMSGMSNRADPSDSRPAQSQPSQPSQAGQPRELQPQELAAVLSNASPMVALFAHLLLRGLSPLEAVGLCGRDVDTAAQTLHVGGAHAYGLVDDLADGLAREIPLDPSLQELIVKTFMVTPAGDAQVLLSAGNGSPISLGNLTSELLYAAHDAALDQPAEVTPDALRHTYAAYLARQGIRLTDLARAVGSLSPDLAARYSAMAPPGKRLGLEQVQRVMPLLLAQPLLQPQSA